MQNIDDIVYIFDWEMMVMHLLFDLFSLILALVIALIAGKLISKLKLPE